MKRIWLTDLEKTCSVDVQKVLIESRRTSMSIYTAKWKRFSIWLTQSSLSPMEMMTVDNLDYLFIFEKLEVFS